jgi:two-component system response regulator
MKDHFDIFLIEDNPNEADLTIRRRKKLHLADRIKHVDEGAEALDFVFDNPTHLTNENTIDSRLTFLELNLPKTDDHEEPQQNGSNENGLKNDSRCYAYLVKGRKRCDGTF